MVLWALEALSVDQVESSRASSSDANSIGESEVLFTSNKLAFLLLIVELSVSWALDFDAQVGLGVDSVSSLANNLLASSSGQGRSGWAFSLNASLTIGRWNT